MSATRRVLSGNLAAWCGIGVAFFLQLILVPIYLSHWDRNVYGLWLTLQSLIIVVELFDYGHQGFLQNEFLRIGHKRRRFLRKMFWASTLIGFMLGAAQLLFVLVGCSTSFIPRLLGIDSSYVSTFSLLLILNIAAWWFTGSIMGIAGRLLSSIGYYAHFAWWGVGISLVVNLLPAVAALCGAGIRVAGIIQVVGIVLLNIPLAVYQWRLLRKEGMDPLPPAWRLGLHTLWLSQAITVTALIDRVRQDGIRLLLAPLAGTGATATFATMRTGANVIQQGVGTITGPIMPELMRFLNARDQDKSEAAFATIWIVILALMAPGAIVLQWIAPSVFAWWTHGKIEFDPVLFALLTFAVLIYSAIQPAIAVVHGNNILSVRLSLALLSGACAIGGLFILIPLVALRGVGIALVIAEVVSAIGYLWQAARWMKGHRMMWPWKAFMWVALSVLVAGLAITVMTLIPTSSSVLVVLSVGVQVLFSVGFWRMLPAFARGRTADLVANRLPFSVGKRLASYLR